ncbi:MAG: cache domain-containing protein [Hyphomicrobiales bacterium]|nr:cache domain-containing protein [Hyphomicrobiales bacterium]
MTAFRMFAFAVVAALPGIVSSSLADDTSQATPAEVVTKVHQAVRLLEEKGKAGFAEFNNPHGPWAWKDSYVFIYNCQKNEMVAHPIRPDLVGRPLMQIRDANNKPIFKELCAAGGKPNGGWVEYAWPKPGEGGLSRKISYAQSADVSFEFGVQAAAGIYNDEVSVEELTKTLNEMMDPKSYKAL